MPPLCQPGAHLPPPMVLTIRPVGGWLISLVGVKVVADISAILPLIEEYDRAKASYDKYLGEAYDLATSMKWSEEKCKLYAREKVRREGLKDPDTYRWTLRWRLGSLIEV